MQNQNETFEQFVTELQLLVKDCGYDKNDEMVRDRIVTAARNSKIREKLLNVGSDLKFAKTLDIARAYEVSHTHCSAVEDKTVNSVKSKKTPSSRDSKKHEQRTGTEKQQISCGKCGYDHGKQQCPAYGKRCNRCKRLNHFQKMCKIETTANPKSRKKRVNTVQDLSESDSDYDLYAGMIHDLHC